MKRRHFLPGIAVLCLCFAMLFATAAFAAAPQASQSMTLTVEVPARHELTLNLGPNGAVKINGVLYSGAQTLALERGQAYTYEIVPDAGYIFESGSYNGTPLDGTAFTAPPLQEDGLVLVLTFQKGVAAPTVAPSAMPDSHSPGDGDDAAVVNTGTTPAATAPKPSAIAQTGDAAQPILWLGLCGTALAALALLLRKSKKQ